MRTHPSWGEGSGVFTGLAEAYRELNGGFIDFEKGMSVGVNGIVIDQATLQDNTIKILITSQLSKLTAPWRSPYETGIKLIGLTLPTYHLWLNGKDCKSFSKEELETLKIRINPDGSIVVV
jgi:hypothetical protein